MDIYLVLIVASLAGIVHGRSPCKCDVPLQFLDEIGCKPVFEEASCCPTKYDCSHFTTRPANKCHLLGKDYANNAVIPDEVVYPFCHVGCRCNKGGFSIYSGSDITCAILDCPEWLGQRPSPGCEWKYDVKKCCKVGEMCPPYDKLAKCNVDGKVFYEGQKFEPSQDKTVKCVCQKGFSGKFEEPHCIKKACLTEIRSSKHIEQYCAPVFFKTSADDTPECPYNFICKEATDVVTPSGKISSAKCKYGDTRLNKGDKFSRVDNISEFEKHNINCECQVPPFVTCIKTIVYDFEKMPAHIRQHLQQ